MSTAHARAAGPFSGIQDFVSSDFLDLASHMSACQRCRGRLFHLRARLESVHALVSTRIVTTAALFAVCALGLLALA